MSQHEMSSVIKMEAHTKRAEPEERGNVRAERPALVARAEEVHCASTNMTPHCHILPS